MRKKIANIGSGDRFAVDTSFVLFFLAVDFGQSAAAFGLETILSGLMLGILLVVPYFLPTDAELPEFRSWLFGRCVIAAFAIILGVMFRLGLGVVFPEVFRFLPMTLLIVTAVVSCYIQFYAMIRLRLAR